MAAISADSFPSFSEICRTAREMEKNLITPTPSQIAGSLHPGESSSIFPKEYEEYTYLLLLSEAHKVERKVFASAYGSSLSGAQAPGAAAPPQLDERKIELASRVVSDYEIGQPPEAKSEGIAGQLSRLGSLKMPQFSFGRKKGESPTSPQPSGAAPAPPGEQILSEVLMARRERMAREEMQSEASPPALSTQQSDEQKQIDRRRGLVPEEADDQLEEVPVPKAGDDEEAFEKPPAVPRGSGQEFEKPQEQGLKARPDEEAFEKPQAAAPSAGQPQSKLGASSKISPRLRAIIEEKLKREEAREREEQEGKKPRSPLPAEEAEEQPATMEENEAAPLEEGQETGMSARERLLSRLQKKEAMPAQAEDGGEKGEMPVEEPEESRPPARQRREIEEEPEEPEEKAEIGGEKPPAKIPAKKEADALPRAGFPFAQKGGILIKPIFAEEVGAQKEEPETGKEKYSEEKEADGPAEDERAQKSEDEESDERMARIQRIIGELSPDKFKAQMETPKKGEIPEEEAEGGPGKAAQKPAKKKIADEEAPEQPEEGTAEKLPVKMPSGKKPLQQKRPGARGKIPAKSGAKPAQAGLPQKKTAGRIFPGKGPAAKAQMGKGGSALQKAVSSASPTPAARVLPPKQVLQGQQTGAKPRVLPGGVKSGTARPIPIGRPPAPKTYVTPARPRIVPEKEEEEAQPEEEEAQQPNPIPIARRAQGETPEKNPPALPVKDAGSSKAEESTVSPAEKEEEAQHAAPTVPSRQAAGEKFRSMKPKKQVLDEPMDEPPTPEMVEEGLRVKQRAEKLTGFARKPHDIAGEASLPAEEEGELAVPKPGRHEEEIPKPEDYERAKEGLRHREQQEEIAGNARRENEDMLEQYAKDNLTWLYEIYKMGGIAREAFLQKVQEKIDEEKQGGAEAQPEPDNPALAALGKQLEKKKRFPWE